jgi:uncharacterized protein YjcR
MGKRGEKEQRAIELYAGGMEIPALSGELGVSQNSLRAWRRRAGDEWDDARAAYRKGVLEDVGSRLTRARVAANQLTGNAKDQGNLSLVLNQALQTMLWDVMGQMQTTDILDAEAMTASIDQIKGLALTLQRTEAAANLNIKRVAEIRKQAIVDVADVVEKAAVQQGMNADQAAFWRQQVLGVQ